MVRGVGRTLQQLHEERAAAEAARLAAEKAEAERRAAEEQRAREATEARRREEAARAEAEARRQAEAEAAHQGQQAEAERRTTEENTWQTALQTGTAEALYAYLNHYPAGAYAREARQLIKQLQGGARGSSSPAPRNVAIALTTVIFAVLAYVLWPKPDTPPAGGETTESSTGKVENKPADNSAKTLPYLSDALTNIEFEDMRPQCLNYLREAMQLDPDNAEIRRAHTLLKNGNVEDARQILVRLTK